MSRVKICPKCGAIAEWDSYFGGTRCTRCDFVERPKPTNYDRFISKTPEELAEWIISIEPAACPYATWGYNDDCNKPDCRQCWLDWLRQEVE